MNYTEMEARVREATNNEPWGTASSLMMEIATGTFNYSTLSEIMPMIYKRFTEKSAEEWRQIYKALQLLEFLIKNGSERVIDDARGHLSLLKMLRQFHYIDLNGKDQGINVRNRAKELAELLGDVDRIRQERKKARATRNKYSGSEGGMGLGSGMSSSGRYGGFGSETGGAGGGAAGYGGYSGGVYGDGGGFGGRTADDEQDAAQSRRDRFDEYDEYDEAGTGASGARRKTDTTSSRGTAAAKAASAKPKTPEVDLFDFGDEDIAPAKPMVAASTSNGKMSAPASSSVLDDFGTMQSSGAGGDDDFDDFQAAPTISSPPPASAQPSYNLTPMPAVSKNSAFPVMSPPASSTASSVQFNRASASTTPSINYSAFKAPPPQPAVSPAPQAPLAPQNQPRPSGFQLTGPNYFGSIPVAGAASTPSTTTSGAALSGTGAAGKPAAQQAKKPASGGDPFASLALGGASKKSASQQKLPTMADMAKQKATQGIWGAPAQQQGGGSGGSLF